MFAVFKLLMFVNKLSSCQFDHLRRQIVVEGEKKKKSRFQKYMLKDFRRDTSQFLSTCPKVQNVPVAVSLSQYPRAMICRF